MNEEAFRTDDGVPVPAVTAEEMRAIDRVAVEDVGLGLLQMMENAGRTLAHRALDMGDGPVLIVTGNGGNGGGGLACARHLANHDVEVTISLDRPAGELTGAAARQYRVLREVGVPTTEGALDLDEGDPHALIVDALIGYGLKGDVREPAATTIRRMNESGTPVVSLDVPSGIDATTGETLGVAVEPDTVLTLALPKTGLEGRNERLLLADVSVPRTVYERLDIEYENPFGRRSWVELLR